MAERMEEIIRHTARFMLSTLFDTGSLRLLYVSVSSGEIHRFLYVAQAIYADTVDSSLGSNETCLASWLALAQSSTNMPERCPLTARARPTAKLVVEDQH